MGEQADIHVKILTAASTDELMEVYDGWADRYDRELLEDWGYTSPQKAVQLLLEAMDAPDPSGIRCGLRYWVGRCVTERCGLIISHRH